jgi:hypothetical protein
MVLMKTQTVILEYCGGDATDRLFSSIQSWNPGRSIDVLDNASPRNRCTCVTIQNPKNTYIGGGILDCYRLAEARTCDNLFFIVNDVTPASPIIIEQFEATFAANPEVVQLTAAVTNDSKPQADIYPWMVSQRRDEVRLIPHADLLCCMIRMKFIESFGAFPMSQTGWGYDWEIAHQARLQNLKIAVADWSIIEHRDGDNSLGPTSRRNKIGEMLSVYKTRYPAIDFTIDHILAEYWKSGKIQFVG